jgi:hypothetical protein
MRRCWGLWGGIRNWRVCGRVTSRLAVASTVTPPGRSRLYTYSSLLVLHLKCLCSLDESSFSRNSVKGNLKFPCSLLVWFSRGNNVFHTKSPFLV